LPRAEVFNWERAAGRLFDESAPRRSYRGYAVMTGEILFVLTKVRIGVRRIKIAMASACPAAQDWGRAAIRLAIAAIARASPA
jgi:hypothetical protein